jgi:hypothetical protein
MVISALNNVMAVIKCCAFTTCTATTACSYQTIAVNKRNYMVISAFNDIDNLAHRDLFFQPHRRLKLLPYVSWCLPSVAVVRNQGFLAAKQVV